MKHFIYILTLTFIFPLNFSRAQWINQSLPSDANELLDIDFINKDRGVTGGYYEDSLGQYLGKVYHTTNAGYIWKEAYVPDSMRVMVRTQMVSDSIVYGAGAYNRSVISNQLILFNPDCLHSGNFKQIEHIGMNLQDSENYRAYFVESTDGGVTWHSKGNFEDSVYYLIGMKFIDSSTGFVIGNSKYATYEYILKTTDGGSHWYYVYSFEKYQGVNDIEFCDSKNGLVVGDKRGTHEDGFILKTTDTGETWHNIYITGLGDAQNIVYIDVNNVLMAGYTKELISVVYNSTDGGVNWSPFHIYPDKYWLDGVNAIPNSGIFIVYGYYSDPGNLFPPYVGISLNYGKDWNYIYFYELGRDWIDVSELVNKTSWYLAGGRPGSKAFLLFSDNSGGLPVELISFKAHSFNGKVELVWETGTEINNRGFEIERKTDNENWRTIGFIDGKGTTTELQNYHFTDDLFAVTSSKLFYRLKQIDFNGNFKYSEKIGVTNLPITFSLEQNYPNPFNPTTKIKYQILEAGLVTLKVYDIIGKEVVTLINEEKPAGSYEVEFDASSLPTGVYFYQLKSGSFVETRKMLLIK